jgi:hypothetical protein
MPSKVGNLALNSVNPISGIDQLPTFEPLARLQSLGEANSQYLPFNLSNWSAFDRLRCSLDQPPQKAAFSQPNLMSLGVGQTVLVDFGNMPIGTRIGESLVFQLKCLPCTIVRMSQRPQTLIRNLR